MRRVVSVAAALLVSGAASASAQTSYVTPSGPGGYTVTTPGQPTTFVTPNGPGSYVATTPGRAPTYISPSGPGGYTVTTPGGYQAPQGAVAPSYGYPR